MSERLLEQLRALGALKEGHFLLSSGRHSGRYVEKFDLLGRPSETSTACRAIAAHFAEDRIDLVAGPTTGGILLAFEVARQLNVPAAYAEREGEGGGRVFRRGQRFRPGARVLVVDDILTTGGSLNDTLAALERHDLDVVGIAVLVDRSGGELAFPAPLFSLATLAIQTWEPGACPLCARGEPLVKPGTTAHPDR